MHPVQPLGLYVHIPFCKQKCIYCDFYSLSGSESQMDHYTDALCAHLTKTASSAVCHTVDTVYFGGGTPSYLGEKRLTQILETVFSQYRISSSAEITLEANPDSADDPNVLRTLRSVGFNRISLGMQSACNSELQTIGRIHTAEQVRTAVDVARSAGFFNLSLDLIYGLPNQTLDRWKSNLSAAAALAPDHLSCYGLKVEPGTPLFARRETANLPDDDAQADMYLHTVTYLAEQGYQQYEISNFARAGKESRHNLKYWKLHEYLGFGPGAHSDFGGARYAYERSLSGYIQGVRDNTLSFSEHESISPSSRAAEWLMLGLRTVSGLAPQEYEQRFSRHFGRFLPFLQNCERAGYASCRNGRWHLTPSGFLVSNQIISQLLDILSEEN